MKTEIHKDYKEHDRRLVALFAALFIAPSLTTGADLKQETLQRWQQYVAEADARSAEHLAPGNTFLASDETSDQSAKLRGGEIVVAPAGAHVPMRVPSGLIHDWIGAVFIPGATLEDVLPIVRDYDRYKDFYRPGCVDSKRITGTGSNDEFSMILVNKSVIARTALDMDYRSSYTRLDDRRWYSVTEATRIQEIADYDTASQHRLAENQGTGLIWRLHSITRFEERDGGVYIEVEAMALSRDIPLALRWMAEPIVRRVSRSSVVTSLQQTQSAVRLYSLPAGITSAARPACAAMRNCSPQLPVNAIRSLR